MQDSGSKERDRLATVDVAGNRFVRDFAAVNVQGALRRIERVERALKREAWLPIGLRSLLAHDLPELKRFMLTRRRAHWRKLADRIHALSMMSFRYGRRLLDSEAVSQLRILDLELSPPQLNLPAHETRDRSPRRLEMSAGSGQFA